MLNIFNVTEFLGAGKYISAATAKAKGVTRGDDLKIKWKFSHGQEITFRVVDMVRNLSKGDLRKIAVVVVSGKDSQFKRWDKSFGGTGNLFTRVKGIHLNFDTDVVPKAVKDWKVTILSLNKNKRHLDRPVRDSFWRAVGDFLRARRPDIVPSDLS